MLAGDVATTIEAISNTLSVGHEEVADLVGVTHERLLECTRGRSQLPLDALLKLDRLGAVLDVLLDVIETTDIYRWLTSPHSALDSKAPCELLNNEDCLSEVKDLVESIEWGNYA